MTLKTFLVIVMIVAALVIVFFFGRNSVHCPPEKNVTNDSLIHVNDSIQRLTVILQLENDGSNNYIKKLENDKKKMGNQIVSYTIFDEYLYFKRLYTESNLDTAGFKINYK